MMYVGQVWQSKRRARRKVVLDRLNYFTLVYVRKSDGKRITKTKTMFWRIYEKSIGA